MPSGIYDRTLKPNQRVPLGRPVLLRLLPEHNAQLPRFRCETLRATLSTGACAVRWRAAEAERRMDTRQYSMCCGCEIGESNAKEAL